jgi:hypothetical protein
MRPLIAPTSPRPRSRQPGCSATLRPASNRTRGNQVREKGISLTHRLHRRIPYNHVTLASGRCVGASCPHRLSREAGLYRASLHYRKLRLRNRRYYLPHALWQMHEQGGFPCRPSLFLISILTSLPLPLLPLQPARKFGFLMTDPSWKRIAGRR